MPKRGSGGEGAASWPRAGVRHSISRASAASPACRQDRRVDREVDGIDNPTTERLLQAFDKTTLTIVHLPDQVIHHVTPLTALQVRILELLGLPPTVYTRLTKL